MLIRSASNSDADAIRSLVFGVLEEYGLMAEHAGLDADLMDIEGNYIAPGGFFDLVFDQNGRLIGTIGLFPKADGVAELRKMYLEREARGRGIGKMLLERVLQRARELGFRRIELETSTKLVEAIGLYKKYGFRPFTPCHMACRCDAAYMLELM